MKRYLFSLLLLLSTGLVQAEPESKKAYHFENTPAEEIVRTLVQETGQKLHYYHGPRENLSFSSKDSSPNETLNTFLKEHGMKSRDSPQGLDIMSAPPLPSNFREALEQSEEMELASLDPQSSAVIGTVKLSPEECREASAALQKSIDEGFDFARCFIPRHSLRIRHEKQDLTMIICFECGYMKISPAPGKDDRIFLGEDQGLSKILERHGIQGLD